MFTARFNGIIILLISFLSLSCKETIIEYRDTGGRGNPPANDQYHGDIVGRVLQNESGAVVYVSQVNVIDSAIINPADGSFHFTGLRLGNYDMTVRADNYRVCKRSNVVVPGGGIAYVGDIDLSTVPDLISDYYPKDKDEVVYDNRFARLSISILFTQPMDRASVENAFTTDPPTEGVFYWGQYVYSPVYRLYTDENGVLPVKEGATITTYSKITSVTYVIARKDCFTDTTYAFTLSTTAHDTSGNHLRFPLAASFKTVQAGYTIYGIQTDPADGDIYVSPMTYNGIRVTFPRRMDPATTESATSVSPNDDRFIVWPQENQMVIYMGGIFRADTLYRVTIDSTAEDLDGVKLGEQFSFSFRTQSVQVQSTYPSNGKLFVGVNSTVSIYFNTYILRSSVESSFSISPQTAGSLSYGGYNQDIKYIVEFRPNSELIPDTKYTVTLTADVYDMFGTKMKTPYSFSFITSPE